MYTGGNMQVVFSRYEYHIDVIFNGQIKNVIYIYVKYEKTPTANRYRKG